MKKIKTESKTKYCQKLKTQMFSDIKKELEKKFKGHKFYPKIQVDIEGTFYLALKTNTLKDEYETSLAAADYESINGISKNDAILEITSLYYHGNDGLTGFYDEIKAWIND
jgi:hypothetical protein